MIIPVGFAHVQHFFSGDNLPEGAACTYGIELDLPVSPDVMAEDLHTLWSSTILIEQVSQVVLERTVVKYGPNDTGPSGEFLDPVVGGASAASTPPNTAVLIRKVTGLGGREGRGRMYVPGVREDAVDGAGVLTTTERGDWQNVADLLLTGLGTNNATMVVLHNSVTAPTEVTALSVGQRVATQRRRLRR